MKPSMFAIVCAATLALSACDRTPQTGGNTPVPVAAPSGAAATDTRDTTASAGPHWNGYGPLHWGMTPEEMHAAFQPGTLSRPPGIGTDDTCHYLIPGDAAQDVRLMVEEGQFVRAEYLTPASTAPGGGQVGWTAAQVRAAYPDGLDERPHKYEDGALYLRIKAPDGESVLLFETDANGTVTRWRMGVAPQVDYVEGCA